MRNSVFDRQNVTGLLAIGLCWAVLYYPWLSGQYVMPYDAIDENYPTLFFVGQSLRHGQMPWWNPYIFAGFPQIADPQALMFSPLITGLMMAFADPTPHSLDLIVLLHILLGGIGMFGLLRMLGLSLPAAILGAIITMGGGAAPARLEHTALIISTTTLPWVAWALLALCRRPSLRPAIALGLATGWMGLHLVQTTYIALLLMAISVAARLVFLPGRLAFCKKAIPLFLLAGVVTLLVCGVQVAALLTFLPETGRDHLDLSASTANSVPWRELLTFLWPNAMGTFSPTFTASIDITESIVYCGIITVLGFIVGVAGLVASVAQRANQPAQRQTHDGVYWLFLCLLAFVVLYALGTNTPFYALLYHTVPGLTLFRRPVDAMFVATLLIAPISALGLDIVLGRLKDQLAASWRSRALLLGAAVLPLVLLCWDLSSHTLSPNRANSWPAGFVAPLPNHYATLDFLRPNTRNPGQPDWRVEFNEPAPLWPDLAAATKLYSTQGYNPMKESRYETVFGVTPNGYAPVVFTPWLPSYQAKTFGLLGVKYIASKIDSPSDRLARGAKLDLAFSADGMNIWENDNRIPRLFSPSRAIYATPDTAPQATASVTNLQDVVVIEAKATAGDQCGTVPLSKIRLVTYHNTEVKIAADGDASSSWLVMTDPATLGWHAYIDGKEVRLFRADSYMRAVCVPPGQHTVSFRFEPFRQMAITLLKQF
jgi:hypothetical protein